MPSLVTDLSSTCEINDKSSNLDGDSISCSLSGTDTFVIDNPFDSNSANGWDYVVSSDGGTISITINEAKNPVSARPAGSITVTTYNKVSGTYYQVDTGSASTTFTPTIGNLVASGNGLTSSNLVTYSSAG
jgi:hypothetical protein